jgi:hypothetical protein
MAFRYDEVVPWGRSYDEYVRMFSLTPDDLQSRILGCGDGPASFNCRFSRSGGHVISADPLYQYSREQIEERIQKTFENVIGQTRKNMEKFNWDRIPSVEVLGETRMAAMREFLEDYLSGKVQGRYAAASLPRLPFPDQAFDLALCSHLLFFYSSNLDLDFHLHAIQELCRVSREVRIFPLVDVNSRISLYLDPVLGFCTALEWQAELIKADYEFQKGGHTMLRIRQG